MANAGRPLSDCLVAHSALPLPSWTRTDMGLMRWCWDSEFKPLLLELAASYNKSTITELAKSPRQALALVLLLDQLSRNCFRGDGIRVVQERYDPLAQAVADYCTAGGRRHDYGVNEIWRPYPPARLWFLTPYMHAESAQLQEKGARMAAEIATDFKGDQLLGNMLASNVGEYMKEHGEVISQFGRFPHRNKVLGRQSTEAEEKWLSETKYIWATTD